MKRLNTNIKTILNFIKPSRKLSVLLFDTTTVWLLLGTVTDILIKPQSHPSVGIIVIDLLVGLFFMQVYPFIVILELIFKKFRLKEERVNNTFFLCFRYVSLIVFTVYCLHMIF